MQRIICHFEHLLHLNKMILIKYSLTVVFYGHFRLIYVPFNEVDKVRECYSYLKLIIQARFNESFSKTYFTKPVSLKRFYWYMKQLQLSTLFKQRNIHGVSCNWIFCMKYLATPNSKNIIAFLHIFPNWHSTLNPHRFDVNITSIRRRRNFDEFPGHFHVLFRCK